jgi:hypothetical protein
MGSRHQQGYDHEPIKRGTESCSRTPSSGWLGSYIIYHVMVPRWRGLLEHNSIASVDSKTARDSRMVLEGYAMADIFISYTSSDRDCVA